ncbi:MAG: adenine nucleotide alpha hydrolase [Deltaproteobacteria bacterium]|nr:MAG: adenine nucleotide alpha hydrolase [Deltaproteobacteria bacterium]
MAPKALVSWSSGKDSAYALLAARRSPSVEIVGLVTTVTARFGRVSMHGVREELLDRQADQLGLPCAKVAIPSPCSNDVYEAEMRRVLLAARAAGVTHVVFGDLFLRDIREYREAQLADVGMRAVFPLWGRDTSALAREMVEAGVRAVLTCVDPERLAPAFAGRTFDTGLLDDLPAAVDPCGENGEFHTFVTAGPMFRGAISVRGGEVVERDGFVFADLLPE